MFQTLYRKYRPQRFDELIGQNHIKITLQNEILTGLVAHAYLFSGPRGIGKTTVARLLAKALNCHKRKEKEFEPCGKCLSCQEISQNKSLDLIEIDAASHTGVDNVRENIIDNVRFTPYRDKFKVFVIDEAHMLSISAFNALLKTLEEPPEHVVFILATTEIHKLPETIISRCQRFDFKKVDLKVLAEHLGKISFKEGFAVQKEVNQKIAMLSDGFVRDALGLLGQIFSIGKKEIKLSDTEAILPRSDFNAISEFVDFLIQKDAKGAIQKINNLIDDGVDIEQFSLDLVDYLRKLALAKMGVNDFFPTDFENKILEQKDKIDIERVTEFLNVFMNKVFQVRNAEIPQLPLEIGIVEVTLKGEDLKGSTSSADTQSMFKHPSTSLRAGLNIETLKNKDIAFKAPDKQNIHKQKQRSASVVSLNKIKDMWPEVIAASKKVNHSVAVALETAEPLAVLDNNLEIAFAHNFYCERFKDVKSRKLIEQILKNVLNCDLIVKCSEMSQEKKQDFLNTKEHKKSDGNFLNDLAKEFGGKVVE